MKSHKKREGGWAHTAMPVKFIEKLLQINTRIYKLFVMELYILYENYNLLLQLQNESENASFNPLMNDKSVFEWMIDIINILMNKRYNASFNEWMINFLINASFNLMNDWLSAFFY